MKSQALRFFVLTDVIIPFRAHQHSLSGTDARVPQRKACGQHFSVDAKGFYSRHRLELDDDFLLLDRLFDDGANCDFVALVVGRSHVFCQPLPREDSGAVKMGANQVPPPVQHGRASFLSSGVLVATKDGAPAVRLDSDRHQHLPCDQCLGSCSKAASTQWREESFGCSTST